tara:strand:- start:14 stop:247 length:234 start_codon:yes stop_codon:yes gene_type:complete
MLASERKIICFETTKLKVPATSRANMKLAKIVLPNQKAIEKTTKSNSAVTIDKAQNLRKTKYIRTESSSGRKCELEL